MNVAALAIRHSRAAALIAFALVAAGAIAAVSLPSSIYPPLEFPRIVVIAKSGTLPPQSMHALRISSLARSTRCTCSMLSGSTTIIGICR